MTIGYLCGKFMPATLGHARLISFAAEKCDKLIVNIIAQPGEPFTSISYRKDPLVDYFKDCDISKINFIYSYVETYPSHLRHGQPESSIWWGNWVKENFGKIDKVFSSENYGTLFAQTIGAENVIYDIDRSLTPISATMCRENPIKYMDYILPKARKFMIELFANNQ